MNSIRFFHVIPALLILLMTVLIGTVKADPRALDKRNFMPMVAGGQPAINCDLPQKNYGSIPVTAEPQGGDPETNADMHLGFRGWAPVSAERKLVNIDGAGKDPNAPQFPAIFADKRTAAISGTYMRYRWDWDCNCPNSEDPLYSKWDVTVLGLAVQPGETIYTPEINDNYIDEGKGYIYQVLYAGDSGITLYNGTDDDYHGYVVHIEDVCVDPDLVDLYWNLHDDGREELPALKGHQAFGVALNNEIKVAVRDTGSFQDPRSRLDWWRGR
jgi:hypothetical protein